MFQEISKIRSMKKENVWDYPRPPKLERSAHRLRIVHSGITLADTTSGFRVLETSHPPVYYLPPTDIKMEMLTRVPGRTSFCEFKGTAVYWDIIVGRPRSAAAAWSYPDPAPSYLPLKDYLAFYASGVDACFVDEEKVQPQQGDFYGGWITSNLQGPFKGGKGTWGW